MPLKDSLWSELLNAAAVLDCQVLSIGLKKEPEYVMVDKDKYDRLYEAVMELLPTPGYKRTDNG